MGKVRRLRNKYHASLTKKESAISEDISMIPQMKPVVVRSGSNLASTQGSKDNIFAGLNIELGAASTDTPKSVAGGDNASITSLSSRNRQGTKKSRRMQRRKEFLQKIESVKMAKKEEKERKKREKTAIVGDVRPMIDALPSLEELLTESAKKKERREMARKGKAHGVKKKKRALKDMMLDYQDLMSIYDDERYKKDPFSVVLEFSKAQVAHEKSTLKQ